MTDRIDPAEQATALRRIEAVLAQARAALADGAVPDLSGLADELRRIGPVAPGGDVSRQLLAVSAEIEMLTRAARDAQDALRTRLAGAGRGQQAAMAYARGGSGSGRA